MRANEFIKKFGWEVAKKNTEKCFDGKAIQIAPLYMLDDLKRYVDAYDLVQSYGGLKESIRFSKQTYRLTSTPKTHKKLCEAITLVEECQ